MKMKSVIEISYHELDDLVEKTYGHPFEVVADLELGNDTAKTMSFNKKHPLDQWSQEDVDEFRKTGKGLYLTSRLMQDMVNNDVLPVGDYIIVVSW